MLLNDNTLTNLVKEINEIEFKTLTITGEKKSKKELDVLITKEDVTTMLPQILNLKSILGIKIRLFKEASITPYTKMT
jgi:predicted nucleotidyltransferase